MLISRILNVFTAFHVQKSTFRAKFFHFFQNMVWWNAEV